MSHNQFEKTEHKSIVKELFEKGFIKKLQSLLCIMTLCLMIMTSAILVPLAVPVGQAKTASVFDYKITNVVQTKPDTIVVSVECTFCSACNPNSAGNPGCTPFSLACGFPPSSYPAGSGWPCAAGCPDGRFAAVQIVGSFGIITQKLVCTPANWPISAVHAQDFTFSGLSLKNRRINNCLRGFLLQLVRSLVGTTQNLCSESRHRLFHNCRRNLLRWPPDPNRLWLQPSFQDSH